jgi:hypothetical protein
MQEPSIHSQRRITSIVNVGDVPAEIEVPRASRVLACEHRDGLVMVWLESLSSHDDCYAIETITVRAFPAYSDLPTGYHIVGVAPACGLLPTAFVGIQR